MKSSKRTRKIEKACFNVRERIMIMANNLKMDPSTKFMQGKKDVFITEEAERCDIQRSTLTMVLKERK